MIARRPAPAVRTLALLALALGARPLPAYDGEDMAPGLARLARFDAAGTIAVTIVAREFSGHWARTPYERLRLLPAHWRAGRGALEGQRDRVVAADLLSTDGVALYCEVLVAADFPAGVCEEAQSRLYYLAPPPGSR
jgi:hypothetical protein